MAYAPDCMTLCLCIDSILFGVCQDPTVEFDVSALHLSPNFYIFIADFMVLNVGFLPPGLIL